MSIWPEVVALRDAYVAFFRQRVAHLRGQERFASELLVRPNGHESSPPFCLVRLDVIYGSPESPEIERVADEAAVLETPQQRTIEGVRSTVKSLSWEECHVRFTSDAFRLQSLRPWLEEWLDVAEQRSEDEHGLSGVVHSIAWSSEGASWELIVDFGSAPPESFNTFFKTLAGAGVRECVLEATDAE